MLRTLTAVVLALAGPSGFATSAAAGEADPSTTLVVAVDELPQTFAAEAVVEAVRQATVGAQSAGRVVELPVKAGDTVRAGQVLVRLDPRSADQAVAASRSQVAEAQANLANARNRFERNKQLLAQKFVSQAAVDQSEAEYKAAQAQVGAMQAGAGQAITQQSYATISAPYQGIVGATHVDLGDMVTPGKSVATVFDPGELRVVATLPQATLSRWNRERAPVVEIPSLGRRLEPTKVTVIPLADPRSHTVRVRLDLPRVEALLPGQYARAQFSTGSVRAIAIPTSALMRRGELTAVYVVGPRGQPQLRQLRLGEVFEDARVEVLAGLSAGERIYANPIAAGMAVAAHGGR